MSIVKVVWLSIKFGGKSDTVNTNKQTKHAYYQKDRHLEVTIKPFLASNSKISLTELLNKLKNDITGNVFIIKANCFYMTGS